MALVRKDAQRSTLCCRMQAGRERTEPLLHPLHAVWEAEDATPYSEEVTQRPISGSHYSVQVCGGQTREKEKRNSSSIKKRDGTGDSRLERSSLL